MQECRDWSVVCDQRPGNLGLPRTWKVRVLAAGYSVELGQHEPTGPVAQVNTTVEVRYEEETSFQYESVTILPDGPSIPGEKIW